MKLQCRTWIFAAFLASAVALEKGLDDASSCYEEEKKLMLWDMAHYSISRARDIYFNLPKPPSSGLSANGKKERSRPYFEKAKQLILELEELYLPAFLDSAVALEKGLDNASSCYKEEKKLMLWDMVHYSISKARDVYFNLPKPPSSGLTANGKKERSRPYFEKAKQLILELEELYLPDEPAIENTAVTTTPDEPAIENTAVTTTPDGPASCENKPLDCSDVLAAGQTLSGVYTIWPAGQALDVYCDMDTDGGGWTVIQRNGNFSDKEDFFRGWEDYEDGFGNVTKDFWLGNENIHLIANQSQYEIRFDLTDAKGDKRFAVYQTFWLDDESKNYTLHIGDYSGNAGDSMAYHNGHMFSTKDCEKPMCAKERKAGWWYKYCTESNLNGLCKPGVEGREGITWYSWHHHTSLAGSEMKLRKKNLEP